MEPVFSALEKNSQLHVSRYDTEPNVAILGSIDSTSTGDSKISGIEASMTGGFDWLVNGKVSCVYGFDTEHSNITVSDLTKDSPSHSKKYSETMKGIEGDINPESVLFFLLRIHKNAYPEELCKDEDFNYVMDSVSRARVQVRKPFVLRLYKKSRQTQ